MEVETELLQTQGRFHSHTLVAKDLVTAGTFGGVIDLPQWKLFKMLRPLEPGVGAEVTSYVVPNALRATYGDHPLSVQVFFRIRPSAGSMGRMWNTRMAGRMRH